MLQIYELPCEYICVLFYFIQYTFMIYYDKCWTIKIDDAGIGKMLAY